MANLISSGFLLVAITAFLFAAMPSSQCSADGRDKLAENQPFSTVVLSYDGKGHFGPQTPDTKTAGWQEALDYCVERKHDLYIKGGWGGQTAIYHVSDTIHIPATQDFKIDGGVYVINWVGPPDKDMIWVDSGMDCHYEFGILVYGGLKAALRIKPENPVPIDKAVVLIDSDIKASSIADPHPFQRGERKDGTGVLFDTTKGPILHSDFHFTAILNFATCISTPSEGGEFAYNKLACGHLHTNADKSTLLRLGKRSIQNDLEFRIGVDQGAANVRGVDIGGICNNLLVTTRGGFLAGNDIIINESADGNQIKVIQRKDPFIPDDIITDRAMKPTNQLTWAGGSIPVRKIGVAVGKFQYTQRLYPATVRIVGGSVSRMTMVRGSDKIECDPPESSLILSTGDQLLIESEELLNLLIIPFKAE